MEILSKDGYIKIEFLDKMNKENMLISFKVCNSDDFFKKIVMIILEYFNKIKLKLKVVFYEKLIIKLFIYIVKENEVDDKEEVLSFLNFEVENYIVLFLYCEDGF